MRALRPADRRQLDRGQRQPGAVPGDLQRRRGYGRQRRLPLGPGGNRCDPRWQSAAELFIREPVQQQPVEFQRLLVVVIRKFPVQPVLGQFLVEPFRKFFQLNEFQQRVVQQFPIQPVREFEFQRVAVQLLLDLPVVVVEFPIQSVEFQQPVPVEFQRVGILQFPVQSVEFQQQQFQFRRSLGLQLRMFCAGRRRAGHL